MIEFPENYDTFTVPEDFWDRVKMEFNETTQGVHIQKDFTVIDYSRGDVKLAKSYVRFLYTNKSFYIFESFVKWSDQEFNLVVHEVVEHEKRISSDNLPPTNIGNKLLKEGNLRSLDINDSQTYRLLDDYLLNFNNLDIIRDGN